MFKTQQNLIICIFADCVEPRPRPIPPPRNRRVVLPDDRSYAVVVRPHGNLPLLPNAQSGFYVRSPIHSTDFPPPFHSHEDSTHDNHSDIRYGDLDIEGENSAEGTYEDLETVSRDARRTYDRDNLSSEEYQKANSNGNVCV